RPFTTKRPGKARSGSSSISDFCLFTTFLRIRCTERSFSRTRHDRAAEGCARVHSLAVDPSLPVLVTRLSDRRTLARLLRAALRHEIAGVQLSEAPPPHKHT